MVIELDCNQEAPCANWNRHALGGQCAQGVQRCAEEECESGRAAWLDEQQAQGRQRSGGGWGSDPPGERERGGGGGGDKVMCSVSVYVVRS